METKKPDGHDNFVASKPTNPEFGASYKEGWLSYTFHFTGEIRPITYTLHAILTYLHDSLQTLSQS